MTEQLKGDTVKTRSQATQKGVRAACVCVGTFCCEKAIKISRRQVLKEDLCSFTWQYWLPASDSTKDPKVAQNDILQAGFMVILM